MTPAAAFGLATALTLALLAGVVVTGLRHERRAHLALVAATLAALVWTVRAAYALGEGYDLAAAGAITPVHLAIAKVATGFLILPAVTGVRLLVTGRGRGAHRAAAFVALALILAAAATGTLMVLRAEPLPSAR